MRRYLCVITASEFMWSESSFTEFKGRSSGVKKILPPAPTPKDTPSWNGQLLGELDWAVSASVILIVLFPNYNYTNADWSSPYTSYR